MDEVMTLEFTVSVVVDAAQIEALPDVAEEASMMDALRPVSGRADLQARILDALIMESLKMLSVAGIRANLQDATSSISERYEPLEPWEAFY